MESESTMSKYIDADKLIAEIERLKERAQAERVLHPKTILSAKNYLLIQDYDAILSFVASLQQEKPDKYETALEKAREWMPNINQGGHAMLIDIFPELGEGLDPRYGSRKHLKIDKL